MLLGFPVGECLLGAVLKFLFTKVAFFTVGVTSVCSPSQWALAHPHPSVLSGKLGACM